METSIPDPAKYFRYVAPSATPKRGYKVIFNDEMLEEINYWIRLGIKRKVLMEGYSITRHCYNELKQGRYTSHTTGHPIMATLHLDNRDLLRRFPPEEREAAEQDCLRRIDILFDPESWEEGGCIVEYLRGN